MTRKILAALAAVVALLFGAGSAQAITITATFSGTLADAQAAELAFIAGLDPVTVVFESFETYELEEPVGLPPGDPAAGPFETLVGDFQQIAKGIGVGGCTTFNNCTGLVVLDATNGVYSGRAATHGENWLDSNDSDKLLFDLIPDRRAVGFYLSDMADVSGVLRVTAYDGVSAFLEFPYTGQNGRFSYVTVTDPSGISTIEFEVRDEIANDGFGIDSVTTGDPVPEPGTLLLLGGGLLGLVARARRRSA